VDPRIYLGSKNRKYFYNVLPPGETLAISVSYWIRMRRVFEGKTYRPPDMSSDAIAWLCSLPVVDKAGDSILILKVP